MYNIKNMEAVHEILKKSSTPMTVKGIHAVLAEAGKNTSHTIILRGLNHMLHNGYIGRNQDRPQTWYYIAEMPCKPTAYSCGRSMRFDWTRETYVPPPPPALRAGALDYQRCKSVGTP